MTHLQAPVFPDIYAPCLASHALASQIGLVKSR